ncbi:Protein F37C4.5 [Toxocara canis]|uniref:Protein F37C4.5 n=1 Tax=Toxocara canis TaxID=6265 RepID=A0A0B2VYI9_TOXCA|nr:Protein F37C4.5 [Toxocara canis]
MSQPKKVHRFNAHDIALSTVTVFNDRAEVKRTLNVELVPGINENVTKQAVTESVRVDGSGSAVIHDVQFQCRPSLPEEGYSPKVKELEEERKKLQSEKAATEDRQSVLKRQVEVLDEIVAKVGGSVVGCPTGERSAPFTLNDESLLNLKKFFSFYEENSVGVRLKLRDVNEQVRIVDEKLRKINDEIGTTQNDERFARHISVLLESAQGGNVKLDISYQVWGAKWFPSYDIRIDSSESKKESKMKLTYHGNIEQHTGEDWIDAPLVLSTAQPSLGGDIPELGTQIAVLYKPPPPAPEPRIRPCVMAAQSFDSFPESLQECRLASAPMAFGAMKAAPVAAGDTVLSTMFVIVRPATIPSDSSEHKPVAAGDTVLSTMFVIVRPATIPSDSSEHKVTVTSMDMKPAMIHETVPSKNTNVFLTASVINSSQFPLLPGKANVYLNNSFVAKSNIKAASPNERFLCSLGVDPAVKVVYKPAHKFSEQVGLMTKSSSTSHEQRILIKNTKNEGILITVNEHIPKSTDEKIKIKLFSPELDPKMANAVDSMKKGELPSIGARLNSAHNLEWTVNLEPNKETELVVKWTVDHPNGETVEYREEL